MWRINVNDFCKECPFVLFIIIHHTQAGENMSKEDEFLEVRMIRGRAETSEKYLVKTYKGRALRRERK